MAAVSMRSVNLTPIMTENSALNGAVSPDSDI